VKEQKKEKEESRREKKEEKDVKRKDLYAFKPIQHKR